MREWLIGGGIVGVVAAIVLPGRVGVTAAPSLSWAK